VRETSLAAADLIMSYFIVETEGSSFLQSIASMPGQFQLSLAKFEKEVVEAVKLAFGKKPGVSGWSFILKAGEAKGCRFGARGRWK